MMAYLTRKKKYLYKRTHNSQVTLNLKILSEQLCLVVVVVVRFQVYFVWGYIVFLLNDQCMCVTLSRYSKYVVYVLFVYASDLYY